MNVRTFDLWAGLVIAIAGLLTTFYLIPTYVAGGFGFGLSPRFFPYLCAISITGLGSVLFFSRLFGLVRDTGATMPFSTRAFVRLLLCTGLLAAGVLIMSLWGYLPACIFLIVAFMLVMGERRPSRIVPTAVGWPLLLWLLFEKLLETPLPG